MTPDGSAAGDSSEELVVYEPPAAPENLFGAGDPFEVVARSTEIAQALADIIEQQGLFAQIGAKRHVLVEGWTLLGSMLGVFPVVVWSRKLENGWEARVEARTLAGNVVGAAEAECLRSESRWSRADDYAVRSMAQTRATSKALRGPLGFIVHLAGFSPAPEAEVSSEHVEEKGVSNDQHAKIGAVIRALDSGMPPDGLENWTQYSRQWIEQQYGKRSRAQLTSAEAHQLIDELQRRLDEIPI